MKKRVLLVGPIVNTYGGLSRFQEDLLGAAIGFEVVHFNTARPPKVRTRPVHRYDEILSAGLPRALLGLAITAGHLLQFPWVLIRKAPAVAHVTGPTYWPFWEGLMYLLMARAAGVRTVFHLLAPLEPLYAGSPPGVRRLIRAGLRRADQVVALSESDAALVRGFPGPCTSVVRSSVPASFGDAARADRRGRTELRVLFVGGIDPFRKGIHDVLKAIPVVAARRERVRFVVTGGDNVRDALAASLDPEWSPRVEFRGWVPESGKAELYRAADLLVLPSAEEGLPYVIIEAMASGLPIVASPVGAVPEVVEDGINGLLVPPGDPQALAAAISRLCGDEAGRLRMGALNHEKAARLYVHEVTMPELESIYTRLTTTSRTAIPG